MSTEVRQLGPSDVSLMKALLTTFGKSFNDLDTYTSNSPHQDYLQKLLGGDSFIALAAVKGEEVVGGITAYELLKFERESSEIYIYDLAVSFEHRREGIATTLINKLKEIAILRGASVIFVQANTDIGDEPAIALYTKLGTCEKVLHFEIAVKDESSAAYHI